MIGALQYLTHPKPDIANANSIVARFQVDLKETHYAAVKRIFRYLKGTPNFGIWYDKSDDFTLCAYTDADWAGSVDDKKSTSGGAFILRGRLVSWLSKKQDRVSKSTADAEYVTTTNSCN